MPCEPDLTGEPDLPGQPARSGRPGLPGRRDLARLGGDPPSPYEAEYGFSRVVRAGPFVMVGGTTSVGALGAVIGTSPYEQTVEILDRIAHELSRGGATMEDVIQLRIYVTDISRAAEVGRAFGERFATIRPLMTMVEVSSLIDPRMLVEIEAVAMLP